jgi:hypothetical protein
VKACREHGVNDSVPETPEHKRALLQAILSGSEIANWAHTKKSDELSTRRSELKRAVHYRSPRLFACPSSTRPSARSAKTTLRALAQSLGAFTPPIGWPAPRQGGRPARSPICSKCRRTSGFARCSRRRRATL